MKLTKLLTGAAIAALLTGAANAQVITMTAEQTALPDADAGQVPLNQEANFASEIGNLNGINVPFEIVLGGVSGLTAETNLEALVTVTLTNAVFDQSLVDADVSGAAGGNCATDGAVIESGGAAGNSSVTFRVTNLASCDGAVVVGAPSGDNLAFSLPLQLTGGDVDFNVSITRASNGQAIASSTYSAARARVTGAGTGPLVNQIEAFDCNSTDDASVMTAASSFRLSGVLAAGNPMPIGTISCQFTGALSPDLNAVNAADLDNYSITVTYESTSGLDIDDATDAAIGAVTPTQSGNSVTWTNLLAADVTNNTALQINAELTGTAGVQVQNPTYVATADFDFGAGFTEVQSVETNEGAFASITREGTGTNVFEWVGDASAPTRNIFRITGLNPLTFGGIAVNLTDSNVLPDATETLAKTAADISNGEMIVTQDDLTAALGNFGRGNISFTFLDTGAPQAAGNIQARRLLVGANGTLTDFGNENADTTPANVGGDN